MLRVCSAGEHIVDTDSDMETTCLDSEMVRTQARLDTAKNWQEQHLNEPEDIFRREFRDVKHIWGPA